MVPTISTARMFRIASLAAQFGYYDFKNGVFYHAMELGLDLKIAVDAEEESEEAFYSALEADYVEGAHYHALLLLVYGPYKMVIPAPMLDKEQIEALIASAASVELIDRCDSYKYRSAPPCTDLTEEEYLYFLYKCRGEETVFAEPTYTPMADTVRYHGGEASFYYEGPFYDYMRDANYLSFSIEGGRFARPRLDVRLFKPEHVFGFVDSNYTAVLAAAMKHRVSPLDVLCFSTVNI